MTDKMTTPLRFHTLAALALVFFAVFMSALVSRTVFERLPHLEDEAAYLFQAKVFAHGDIVMESPTPRRAFWMPFVLDHVGPDGDSVRFGKYTPGYPLLLALGILLGQTWVINAFCAGLTVALVFRLGSEIFNEDVGLIAAALLAFSPMALLLNATIMNHTSALMFVMLFIYAYWRMERKRKTSRNTLLWGLVAGFALGMVAISRPLSAMALALPFVMWSVSKLIRVFIKPPSRSAEYNQENTEQIEKIGFRARFSAFFNTLRPLVALGLVTLVISASIPLFNYAATGDPAANLYTLVWSYDRIGFGEGYGRHGHTIQKGIQFARFDLTLTGADLFGWQITPFNIGRGELPQLAPFTSELADHVRTQSDYFPVWGISWLLLPFGLWAGFGKRVLPVICWWCITVMVIIRTITLDVSLIQDSRFSWMWIIGALLWVNIPVLFFNHERSRWLWLLLAVPLTIVVGQMTYWIGSQLYSTRYFFEGLGAFCLLSALPLAWLARNGNKLWRQGETALRPYNVARLSVYAALMIALVYGLYSYSTPRIGALRGFNSINSRILVEVNERREGDRPVLVLVTGPDAGDNRLTWRALAALNSVTSPYFDSEIVVAWNFGGDDIRQQILEQFPDRQLIEMTGTGNVPVFVTEDTGG
jgi:hypothetical protein